MFRCLEYADAVDHFQTALGICSHLEDAKNGLDRAERLLRGEPAEEGDVEDAEDEYGECDQDDVNIDEIGSRDSLDNNDDFDAEYAEDGQGGGEDYDVDDEDAMGVQHMEREYGEGDEERLVDDADGVESDDDGQLRRDSRWIF